MGTFRRYTTGFTNHETVQNIDFTVIMGKIGRYTTRFTNLQSHKLITKHTTLSHYTFCWLSTYMNTKNKLQLWITSLAYSLGT